MHKDVVYAEKMDRLMNYSHPFAGIPNHLRLRIVKYLYPDFKHEIETELLDIVAHLFAKQEREFHYVALDLIKKNLDALYRIEYFSFIKDLAEQKPNWDTIDIYAKDILGKYLQRIPELTQTFVNLFINSNNEWKIRSIILFQVNYKQKTNKNLLFLICLKFIDTKNYMIHSAMVWALKEYQKINPEEVANFIKKNDFLLIYNRKIDTELTIVQRLVQSLEIKKTVYI
ncbi:DNA alkylation repair protein [Flavobacterium agricola]|uniref:DNA alkylation repair protein n=2 Tax=Flavobacterium agricola TaxID=2870839 RepID=A0ABY6LZ70_9FLAO|nr:DNA alkylation repair protein [Flavobacterium agricola]